MIEYKLKAIEEKHLLSTLLYLYENGESIKTEIYSNVSRNPRMPLKLDLLEECGLITMDRGTTTTIKLTEKGTRVASHIQMIEFVL